MADDTQTATSATTTVASAPTPDASPLSIPDFAAKIRKRDARLTPELVDDATLVRKVLERKPELTKYVQSSEPRRKLRDRTPTAKQLNDADMQKFFENHPLLREAALGAASGLGIPESTSSNIPLDMAKGMYQTATDAPQTQDEIAFVDMNGRVLLPAYRIVKGIIQQTKGYGQEMYDAVDWNKFFKEAKSGKGGKNPFDLYLKREDNLVKDEKGNPKKVEGRSVGAEHMVHGLAGMATMIVSALTGGKKVPEVAEAGVRAGETAVRAVTEGPTVSAQRMAGTGPALAKETAKGAVEEVAKQNTKSLEQHAADTVKHAEDVEKITDKNAAATADYHTKIERINQDFDQKITEAKEKYAGDVAARDQKVADLQGKHAEDVAKARGEWVKQAHEARKASAGVKDTTPQTAAAVEGKRETMRHAQQEYIRLVDENVKKTHASARGTLDARYNAVRKAVGEETPLDTKSITAAVEEGRKALQGAPADLKVFNDLINQIESDPASGTKVVIDSEAIEDRPESGTEPARQLTWGEGRTHYSATGEKMFSGELPHNVFKALDHVRKVIDGELETAAIKAVKDKAFAAASKGNRAKAALQAANEMKREYGQLKQDWKQYEADWRDMSGQATGGSPLARMLKAVDDPVVAAQVLGRYGDRLMETFARYTKFGAAPKLMAKLRNYATVAKSLKVRLGDGMETRTYAAPGTEGIRVPARPTIPAGPKEVAPVKPVEPSIADIEAERAKKIERTDKPESKPIPEAPKFPDMRPAPSLDEIVQKTREAKVEQAKVAKEGSLTLHRHDAILALISGLGAFGWHNFGYALPYIVGKAGEAILVSSEIGQRWLSRVTPQDIRAINEVLAKVPDKRAPVAAAITNGLIEKAKSGGPMPPLKTFERLLNQAQMGAILRVVSPPESAVKQAQQSQ